MSAFSDYLEGKIIDATLRGADLIAPTATYISLHEADPTDAVATANANETTYSGYSRQTMATNQWNAPANGVTSNIPVVNFPANGDGVSTTITHVGVYDNSTGGNLLYHAALTTSKTLEEDGFVDPVDELRPEMRADSV